MPKVFCALPETEESILRPVVRDIVATVQKLTRIPDDTRILFPTEIINARQHGSSLDEAKLTGAKFASAGQIHIEVDEQYDEDTSIANAVMYGENYFITQDDSLEVAMRPVYVQNRVTLNLRYRAKDKVSAKRWRDGIRSMVSMDRGPVVMNVKYSYPLPNECMVLLNKIYQMRETAHGYGQQFDEWFRGVSTNRLTWLTNQSGSAGIWAVQETLVRVIGYWDFTAEPEEGSREDETGTWTINVAFKVNFDKPIGAVLYYPLVIHNQAVPQDYRPSVADKIEADYENIDKTYGRSNAYLQYFEAGITVAESNLRYGVDVPAYDEFIPNNILPKTTRLYTVMLLLDETNPKALYNYSDITSVTLDASVKAFLLTEYQYVNTPYASIFNLALYEGKKLRAGNSIAVDAAGNVSTTFTPDFRKYYHVRLSIVNDLAMLNPAAIDRLCKNGAAALIILDALDPTLKPRGLLPALRSDGSISKKSINDTINGLTDSNTTPFNFNTVMTLTVETHHMEEL